MYAIVNKETGIAENFIECDVKTLEINVPDDCYYIEYECIPNGSIKIEADGSISKVSEVHNHISSTSDAEKTLSTFMYGYSDVEISTFYRQEVEATAYLNDSQAYTPLLDILTQKKGVPKELLAKKIKNKAEAYIEALADVIVSNSITVKD